MTVLGIDLGGTKLATAAFSADGKVLHKETTALSNRKGKAVGQLISSQMEKAIAAQEEKGDAVQAIGIAVPGISRPSSGTVWAPNIPEWEDYPLFREVQQVSKNIPLIIDSDRACYIAGEVWQGAAQGCKDAIYLAVGTGIGAGIMVNGNILRGAHDIAGAIGWMALQRPFEEKYIACGCFEYYASGEGVARTAKEFLQQNNAYAGELRKENLTAYDVFAAYEKNDAVAVAVVQRCIEFWGMAVANLVSLFNPEKIILGGGVFGPAVKFIPAIQKEATLWAQPISITQVSLESSTLGNDAGLYGAAFLALQKTGINNKTEDV